MNMKSIYAAMAKGKALRNHAEACDAAISGKAGEWLQNAEAVSKRMDATQAEALDPKYNAVGALNLARGVGILRRLRDGA